MIYLVQQQMGEMPHLTDVSYELKSNTEAQRHRVFFLATQSPILCVSVPLCSIMNVLDYGTHGVYEYLQKEFITDTVLYRGYFSRILKVSQSYT